MTDDTARQEEFVSKVQKLGVAIIKYKEDKDRAKLSFEEVITLREEVLQDGHELGLTEEIIIQMLYDATKKVLSEYYIRRLFSGDFNRKMLPKIPENSNNADKKEIENSSCNSNPENPLSQPGNNFTSQRELKNESEDVVALRDELEGTIAEIQFLKENKRDLGFVLVDALLYHKLRNTVTSAIRNNLPCIRFRYEGDQVKDFEALRG